MNHDIVSLDQLIDRLQDLLQQAQDPERRSACLSQLRQELENVAPAPPPQAQPERLQQAVDSLWAVLRDTAPPALPPEGLHGSSRFEELYVALYELRSFALALANGDLSRQLPMKGYTAGALKTLQAHLSHLTWQTQMIAQGDFSHRVDFMGEFSSAFNSMVSRLSTTLKSLRDKEEALTRANAELQQEIAQRRKTEEELRRSEERYRQLASTDPLTGLSNRRRFFSLALQELKRSCRYGHPLALVMIDVDHFKRVNDTHGHAVGDMVLQGVAARIREALRDVDLLARYGGEEFVAMLPETDTPGAASLAERLRQSLAASPLPIGTGDVQVTASFGVCGHRPLSGATASPSMLERLVNLADQSLYEAKHNGRNRVESRQFS